MGSLDVKPNACELVKNYGTAVGLTIGPEEVCVYDKTAHKPLKLLTISGEKIGSDLSIPIKDLSTFCLGMRAHCERTGDSQ